MMTRLDPDLLRACAAYLAHVDAYGIENLEEVMDLLREYARKAVARRGWSGTAPVPPDSVCGRLTLTHINAIHRYARDRLFIVGQQDQRHVPVARAILDATPNMLAWWCERLREGEASS